jgi:hypothetical protein
MCRIGGRRGTASLRVDVAAHERRLGEHLLVASGSSAPLPSNVGWPALPNTGRRRSATASLDGVGYGRQTSGVSDGTKRCSCGVKGRARFEQDRDRPLVFDGRLLVGHGRAEVGAADTSFVEHPASGRDGAGRQRRHGTRAGAAESVEGDIRA